LSDKHVGQEFLTPPFGRRSNRTRVGIRNIYPDCLVFRPSGFATAKGVGTQTRVT